MSSIFLFDHDDEPSNKINIDELYDKRKRRDLKQLSVFNKIVNRIHKRIQFTAKSKNCKEDYIWYLVPEYLVGEPVYDKGDCIGYIVSQLENNGFFVKYIHPNALFIGWHNWVPSYVRNEIKKKTGVVIDEKGNVIESNNEATDGEDPNNNILNRTNGERNNENNKKTKEYTSVKDYKPSGNLVYGEDMMNNLEKKIRFNN